MATINAAHFFILCEDTVLLQISITMLTDKKYGGSGLFERIVCGKNFCRTSDLCYLYPCFHL